MAGQLHLSEFYSHPSTPPQPNNLPPLLPRPPLVLSMCPLQQFQKKLPHIVPFPLPSGSCQAPVNFKVSGCVLFAFFFVDYVTVKGEIIWYLSLTTWLISLSINSPVPPMQLQRVGSPSFFLLHSIPFCKCTTVF